jgi:hypothetical protein
MQASVIVTSGSKVNVACPWIRKTLLKQQISTRSKSKYAVGSYSVCAKQLESGYRVGVNLPIWCYVSNTKQFWSIMRHPFQLTILA